MDVVVEKLGVTFTWDREKASANERLHGVDFDDAIDVFFDPFILVEIDPDHLGEDRFVAVGLTEDWRCLFVVHLQLGESIRLISARIASAHQRRKYESR